MGAEGSRRVQMRQHLEGRGRSLGFVPGPMEAFEGISGGE